MKKVAAVYIGSIEELNYFGRMANGLEKFGVELIILSNKISILLRAKIRRYAVYPVKNSEINIEVPDLSRCFDIVTGRTNINKAKLLYKSVYKSFEDISDRYSQEYIFIWNGLTIQTLAASHLALNKKIKTRYFELSNIPGKIFADTKGVNAGSALYCNPEVLIKKADIEKYSKWVSGYINFKSKHNYLPERKRLNFLLPLDLFAFRFLHFPENGETNFRKKITEIFWKYPKIRYDEYSYMNKNYVFLPLQVSNDTQLLFHSGTSGLDAVDKALKIANEKNMDLLVKLHPAENDSSFIRQVVELRNEKKFYLVNYPAFMLAQNASMVITINSTVGLESKILGKPVKFLGDSFYTSLGDEHLRSYILDYLIDGTFHGNENFDSESISKILNMN